MELSADWLKCLEQIHLCVNVRERVSARSCAERHVMGKVWREVAFALEIWRKRSVDLAKQQLARCWSSALSVLMMWCFHQTAAARYLITAVRWRPLIKHQRSIYSIVMGWNEELIPGQHFQGKWPCSLTSWAEASDYIKLGLMKHEFTVTYSL